MVESQPSKLLVAGSIPVSRSSLRRTRATVGAASARQAIVKVDRAEARQGHIERRRADVAQLAERVLGKDEVTSSILVIGSSFCHADGAFNMGPAKSTGAPDRGDTRRARGDA